MKSKMFCEASGCVLPPQKCRPTTCTTEDFSEISLKLSIQAGIGPADGTPVSRSITRTQNLLLDTFVAITGYARKYAIHLLNHPGDAQLRSQQTRLPHYGPEVQQALLLAWKAANQICAKRLIPFLPTLVEALERHGHLRLSEECRNQLLSVSATTADRLLRASRQQHPHGVSTTRAGTLLKNQIPIRTFQDWNETQPGLTSSRSGRPLRHTGRGRLPLHPDAHGHCGGLDRMPPAPLPQSGDGAGSHPTCTNALSFPDSGDRYR